MPKKRGHKPNRGQMRAEKTRTQAKSAHARADFPHVHPLPDTRIKLNWNAPIYPGAFAHVLNVFVQHGVTTLKVCLENHKHIRFTLPLSDCFITQHHA
jgi:hypothetical protein